MANEFRKQKKKQKYLLGVVGLIILTIAGVLYFGFFREREGPIIKIVPVTSIKEIKVDFGVLENPFLEKMKSFEKIPEYEGEIGRENPFIPF